jgi:flagellar motor switch protein FliN/FliY
VGDEEIIGDNLSDDELTSLMSELMGGEDLLDSGPQNFNISEVQASTVDEQANLERMMDIGLNVRIELGRTKMYIEDLVKLGDGAIVELDKLAGDPVDVRVNGKLVARGEILVLNENFCVRLIEIVDPKERA